MKNAPQYTQQWFEQAYLAVRPKLRAFIRSVIFSAEDAEDVLQEVAAIAWEKIEKLRSKEQFQPWLFGIAKNRVMKYCTKISKQRSRSLSPEAMEALWSERAVSVEVSQEPLLDALQNCLSKLSAENQSILLERHQPSVTNRMIAEKHGFSESKTSRLMNTLYADLMKCIHNIQENS